MTQWGLDTLFNPAKRHMDEEKRRLQSTREEVGDNSGGRRIDLESGKVVIRKAEDDADEPTDAEPGVTTSDAKKLDAKKSDAKKSDAKKSDAKKSDAKKSDAKTADGTTSGAKPAGASAPSAAAQRAAARRGRTAR